MKFTIITLVFTLIGNLREPKEMVEEVWQSLWVTTHAFVF